MENCVFCKIIDRKIPAFIIDEDDDLIVFVSRENHPLIVPKQHLQDLFALTDGLASLVIQKSRKIAKATKEALSSDGIYITQTNGEAAGQDVFHYHMHVYPKFTDGHKMETDDESRKLTAEKIRELLKAPADPHASN